MVFQENGGGVPGMKRLKSEAARGREIEDATWISREVR